MAKLPDDVLWKIFEFKPATDYKVGCAIYVEETCLKKVCPGEFKRLKVSVLFKFNSNIDENCSQHRPGADFGSKF